jgi:hypothetical protein
MAQTPRSSSGIKSGGRPEWSSSSLRMDQISGAGHAHCDSLKEAMREFDKCLFGTVSCSVDHRALTMKLSRGRRGAKRRD